jgi:hypothetical protein
MSHALLPEKLAGIHVGHLPVAAHHPAPMLSLFLFLRFQT